MTGAGRLEEMNESGRHVCPLSDRKSDDPEALRLQYTLLYANSLTFVIDIITNVIAFTHSITNVKTFGDRLRHARTLRGLTQADLARACGLSQGAIGNYEANSRHSAKKVFRIAEALHVNVAWLAMGTGPMEPKPTPQAVADGRISAPWPFPDIDPERFWSLSAQQRQVLSNALAGMITAMEDGDMGTHT